MGRRARRRRRYIEMLLQTPRKYKVFVEKMAGKSEPQSVPLFAALLSAPIFGPAASEGRISRSPMRPKVGVCADEIVILLISPCPRRRQAPRPVPLKLVSALLWAGFGTVRGLPQRSQKMSDGSGKNCRIFSASPLDMFIGEHGMIRDVKF